jgi:predicted adenylyl cyclase CyaB
VREIEVRTRLSQDKVATIPQILDQMGFHSLGSWEQFDVMFDRPDGSLFNGGSKIRLRRERETMELTYKGSMLGRTDISDRTETNIKVAPEQFDECKRFLAALGFPQLFQIKKERHMWRRGSVSVTLDYWPIIGPILEFEGPEDEIIALTKPFGAEYHFANYRLRYFFEQVEGETGKSLSQLQKEYEEQNDIALGRLDLLIGQP